CSSFCIVRLDDTGLEGGVAEHKYKGGLNGRPPSAHQRAFLHVRAMYESKGWSEIALNGAIRILEGVRRDRGFAVASQPHFDWRIYRIGEFDISTENKMNRMRMACVCGLAVMFCLAARAMADAPPEGFEALFDGKDLSNFKASEEQKKHWII